MKATAQPLKIPLQPAHAWMPIAPAQWTEATVRHLLRRAAWTARPADVKELVKSGPGGLMEHLYGRAEFPHPHPILEEYVEAVDKGLEAEIPQALSWAATQDEWKERAERIKAPSYRDPHARAVMLAYDAHQRELARERGDSGRAFTELRQRFKQQEYWTRYALEWLKTASTPRHSAMEKFNLFLQNVLVVNVRSLDGAPDFMADIHNFHRVIRENCFGPYPVLVQRMYKTAAMGRMLDLVGSTKGSPNENFAREVMELFTLGVSRGYDEDDIKEAAKAFTGYVIDPESNPYIPRPGQDELVLDPTKHDDSRKRVLGRSSRLDGDGVIHAIFNKPDAEKHLLRHLTHEYLVEGGLPDDYLEPLGKEWRRHDFDLKWLLETFLLSRIFHHPLFRGRLYKSPFQFYLGLIQDLGLQVETGTEIVREMDYLGQRFADPPDVNGWDGGAFWMNNGTINARRIIVERLFAGSSRGGPATAMAGAASYIVTDDMLRAFIEGQPRTDAEMSGHFLTYFVAVEVGPAVAQPLEAHLAAATPGPAKVAALREVIRAILQSQYYQVC
jgi:uncharacterized protein (DUF1800 family)